MQYVTRYKGETRELETPYDLELATRESVEALGLEIDQTWRDMKTGALSYDYLSPYEVEAYFYDERGDLESLKSTCTATLSEAKQAARKLLREFAKVNGLTVDISRFDGCYFGADNRFYIGDKCEGYEAIKNGRKIELYNYWN